MIGLGTNKMLIGSGGITTTLPDGLLACWEFNETSGTTVYDSHSDNNGTNYGASIGEAGRIGTAYGFNGISSRVVVPNNSEFGNLSQITISAWVYSTYDSSVNEYRVICSKLYPTWNNPYYQFMLKVRYGSYKYYEFTFGGGSDYGIANTPNNSIVLGEWVHVICIYRSNTGLGEIYLNGNLVGTSTDGVNPTGTSLGDFSTPFVIGDDADILSTFKVWNGLIDQNAIWNRALTQQEISDLYNNGNGRAYSEF